MGNNRTRESGTGKAILVGLISLILLVLSATRPAIASEFMLQLGMNGSNTLDITRGADLSAWGQLSGGATPWTWVDVNSQVTTTFTGGLLEFNTTGFTLSGIGFNAVKGTVDYQFNRPRMIDLGVTFGKGGGTYSGDISFTYGGGNGTNLFEQGGSGTFTMKVPEAPPVFMLLSAFLFVVCLARNLKKS